MGEFPSKIFPVSMYVSMDPVKPSHWIYCSQRGRHWRSYHVDSQQAKVSQLMGVSENGALNFCQSMAIWSWIMFHQPEIIYLLVLSREWGNDPHSLVIIIPFPQQPIHSLLSTSKWHQINSSLALSQVIVVNFYADICSEWNCVFFRTCKISKILVSCWLNPCFHCRGPNCRSF